MQICIWRTFVITEFADLRNQAKSRQLLLYRGNNTEKTSSLRGKYTGQINPP